jgi:hypothetical protein
VLDGSKDRLRLEHHPVSPPEGTVIDDVVPVVCKRAQVVNVNRNQRLLTSPPNDPVIDRPSKELREDRQQIKTHNASLFPKTEFQLELGL